MAMPWPCRLPTRASASRPRIRRQCSRSFARSARTTRVSARERAWGWRSPAGWSSSTAGRCRCRASSARARPSPSRSRLPPPMAGELILIVEDNEKNRRLVRDVLQFKGYQTIETETGEEALELARSRKPALVLMDIQLPGMDGIAALKRLREDPATRAIRVMAVTA